MLASLLLAIAPMAPLQSEYWVHPTAGSDTASGTSAGTPWRSLTHAASAAVQPATIHLAPGTYSTQSGESFPITLSGDLLVQSLEGRSTVEFRPSSGSVGILVENQAHLEDVTVIGGDVALRLRSGGQLTGVHARSGYNCIQAVDGVIRDCQFTDAWSPVWHMGGCVLMEDCVVRRGVQFGVYIPTHYQGDYGWLTMRRCEVTDCSGHGILASDGGWGTCFLRLESTLVARNGSAGSSGWPGLELSGAIFELGSLYDIQVIGCTFTGNKGPGIDNRGGADVTIRSTIVAGNLSGDLWDCDDIEHSLIGDASGLVGAGPVHPGNNLSGDPGFIDAAGNYSLRFDSPAVDAGQHPGFDLLGVPRAVDGDLDLLPAPDMGAFEHRTLTGPSEIPFDAGFELAASGPSGGFATVVISPAGYGPFGASTQFGRFFLNPDGAYRLVPVLTTGGPPSVISVVAFDDPALVGTSVGFQALTRSLAAPAGGAFSEPLLVPIVE